MHDVAIDQQEAMLETPSDQQISSRFALAGLDKEALRGALHKMHLIRKFEEAAEQSYMRGH